MRNEVLKITIYFYKQEMFNFIYEGVLSETAQCTDSSI